MCNRQENPVVADRQTSGGFIVNLLMTAERELAAFYTVVAGSYGPEEARRAACDWIEEMETMNWPSDGAVPDWRHVSMVAADCLATRVVEHSLLP